MNMCIEIWEKVLEISSSSGSGNPIVFINKKCRDKAKSFVNGTWMFHLFLVSKITVKSLVD